MIEFWRLRLSDSSKKRYDELLEAIRQQKRSVDLAKERDIVNEIQIIYRSILSDHPELYYVSPQLAISLNNFSLNASLSYLYDTQQRQTIDRSFDGLKKELKKEQNRSEMEKVYAAAFLIMKNSRYEINNIFNQNAASAIHYHVAQCSGFASAFKYAMDLMGIWCITVSGSVLCKAQSCPHGWNIVKINDAYFHIDITSLASMTLTDISQLSRCRLLESDAQKKQQGYIWEPSETPACSEMKMCSSAVPMGPANEAKYARSENTAIANSYLPTFSRLFDVQAKVRECLKNRTTYYEFALNIPMYSDEKLVRMIIDHLSEQGKELSVAYEAEVGHTNGRFYLKINYND